MIESTYYFVGIIVKEVVINLERLVDESGDGIASRPLGLPPWTNNTRSSSNGSLVSTDPGLIPACKLPWPRNVADAP